MDEQTQDVIKQVLDQDPRRRQDASNSLLLNEKGLQLSRVIKIGKGAYNTEWVEFNGEQIPLRLLSVEEEDTIKYETHKELRNEKSIYNLMKDDPAIFERVNLYKRLSMATTPNPGNTKDPYLKEKDIKALPSPAFAALIYHYDLIEKEYNPRIGNIPDEESDFLINELLNSKKKSLLVSSLRCLQMQSIILKLLEKITEQQDNIGMLSSLKDLYLQEKPTQETM